MISTVNKHYIIPRLLPYDAKGM